MTRKIEPAATDGPHPEGDTPVIALDLYDPKETLVDAHESMLLDVKAAEGKWCILQECDCEAQALAACVAWLEYCDGTRWQAFDFTADGCYLKARFVGTRMKATKRTANKVNVSVMFSTVGKR